MIGITSPAGYSTRKPLFPLQLYYSNGGLKSGWGLLLANGITLSVELIVNGWLTCRLYWMTHK